MNKQGEPIELKVPESRHLYQRISPRAIRFDDCPQKKILRNDENTED